MMGLSPLILVVDDDEMVRINLQVVLTMEGYAVLTADRGAEALEIVNESPPDLVVLDISMPEMDGWEALRRLRSAGSGAKLPVVALTGDDRSPGVFRKAGFNACLFKGGSLDEFLCTIRTALVLGEKSAGSWLHSCNGLRCVVEPAWEEATYQG